MYILLGAVVVKIELDLNHFRLYPRNIKRYKGLSDQLVREIMDLDHNFVGLAAETRVLRLDQVRTHEVETFVRELEPHQFCD